MAARPSSSSSPPSSASPSPSPSPPPRPPPPPPPPPAAALPPLALPASPSAPALPPDHDSDVSADLSPSPPSPSRLTKPPASSPPLAPSATPTTTAATAAAVSAPPAATTTVTPDPFCVICFERPHNVTLDPCGHANLCDVCVSRLVKRRCPTCRARARKVSILRAPGVAPLVKAVRDVIAERKQRETAVLEDTLQIVFLGPEKVGKKTLVRKLLAKFPLQTPTPGATAAAVAAAAASVAPPPARHELFSDGTDFSPNCAIAGAKVRLTVLRRTTLASRRMVLDDVRVLKPDVLVLCCSAHVAATFDTVLAWDKVLRNNFQKPRVWALLQLDDDHHDSRAAALLAPSQPPAPTPSDTPAAPTTAAAAAVAAAAAATAAAAAAATTAAAAAAAAAVTPREPLSDVHDVAGAINAIFPPDLRPKGHYYCSPGEQFSIGFRKLAKDMVAMGRLARDEELAALIALEEARSLRDQEAAGTFGDTAAANLVIANNGIAVPGSSASLGASAAGGGGVGARAAGAAAAAAAAAASVPGGRPLPHVGRSFSLRGFRERGANGQGISLSGIVSWLAGSHES